MSEVKKLHPRPPASMPDEAPGSDISVEDVVDREISALLGGVGPLFERTPAMMHSIDLQGRILGVSNLWLEVMGYRREEVVGRKVSDFLTPKSRRKALEETIPRFIDKGYIENVDYQFVTRSGEVRDILLAATANRDQDGKVLSSVAVLVDVTDKRKAEIALRESERRLAKAQELARIGYWGWSLGPEGMSYVSRHYTAILGLTLEEVPRRQADFNRFLHPEDRERVTALFESVEAEPRDYEVEYRIVRPDGGVRYVVEIGELTYDDAGRPNGHTGTLQDVTTMKQAERALVVAKQEAEIASRAKSEFLANMSHELRTPLNVIIGFAELIEKEKLGPIGNPAYPEHAGQIRAAGDHLLELISDLLDMSRVEAQTLSLLEEDLDVSEVIRDSVQLAGRRLNRRDVELDVPEGLPGFHGDERRLKQVLINLLSNAFKFTPEGGRISVGASVDPDAGFLIRVADTGIGMAAEDIPKALAPFGQVDGSLARDFNGTGLGLPLSKALVEMHGGTLALESALGAGTTVTLRLPAARIVRRAAD